MTKASDPRCSAVRLALPPRRVLKAFDRREVMAKAQDAHAERPFWGRHPDPVIARIEEAYYAVGRDFLLNLYAAALGRPAPKFRSISKAFHLDPGSIDGWGKLEELFSSKRAAPDLLTGWDALVQKLTTTLLPDSTVEAAASRMAIQSNLMWRLGNRVMDAPDLTWEGARNVLSTQAAASMGWAKVHGMAYLRGLSEEARKSLRMLLVASKEAGEGSSGLQRRMFDGISELNHDWRRIALTETAIATTNGQLASVPAGVKHQAKWLAGPLACKHCLGYHGAVFAVLHAPTPSQGLAAVWPGKNNVGRSAYRWSRKEGRVRVASEMYWPCQPLHPLCCCSFVVYPA